jgi:protein containing PAS/PAC domain
MSSFFKQSSRSRLLGTLGTVAVSALVLSGCATENPSSDSSSPASASASVSASAHASSNKSSSASPQVSEQGTAEASANASSGASAEAKDGAKSEATSSDGQKLEEIYTGAEEMRNASSVPVDAEEVKKTTELVNSFETILTKVKAAPSAEASPERAADPTSDEEAEQQNVERARAVLDDETIRSIEAVAVDSAAAEFAVQASEYALAGWHYEGSSTVVGTPRMTETQYKGQPARMLEVCMDSSSVKIYDENNQPVKDDNSPKRSLNIYTLVQVDGQWKIATHDFPNNPDC